MKKLILTFILVFVALSTTAQTIGDAFYIYRNDGEFNAFFRDEVDSITYSHYDNDSVYYNEIVSQVVYTPDRIYCIPLAAIDSISFVQPEIILKQEARSLTGTILNYLVKYEGACLYFLKSIPSDLKPRVGDRLVTIEMTDMFPVGFLGEVISVKNEDEYIVVEFGDLDLEDVFESYSYSVEITTENESTSRMRVDGKPIDMHINIPMMAHSWSIGGGYSMFSVSNTVEASLTPKFHIKGNDIVVPKRGRQTDIRVTCNYTTGLKYEFGFEVAPDPLDFPFPGGRGEEPIAPFLSFFWDFGVFVGVSGSLTYSQTFSQEYVGYIDYKREGIKMPNINFTKPLLVDGQRSEPRIALNGSVRGGFYGEVGIKPWAVDKNLMGKASGRLEIGIEANMEHGIDIGGIENADKNTQLYDFVDHAEDLAMPTLTIGPYASVDITVAVGPWHVNWTPWKGKIGSPFYQGGFFPHFSNTSYERTDRGLKFSSDLSRTCPFPWQIGFSVFDINNNHVKTQYFNRTYRNPLMFDTYDVVISGLNQGERYKVYPAINVFNHDVLASPFVDVIPCPVQLSDFKITSKQHKERGFTNDGLTYDYRFDVSVTATIGDADDVYDWGYLYRDPNGRDKKVSLVQPSGYGTSYTDTRWTYYRNGTPPFTCILVPYVEYVDSEEPIYGEPHIYPLDYEEPDIPDNAVDLGLSVLWAKWNVGASTESAPGGLYGWADPTGTNTTYNVMNESGTAWTSSLYGGKNPPTDICGTSLDIAAAKWGGDWRLPTEAEMAELIDKCSWEWTVNNGTPGMTVTGPNGNNIFLPAGGDRFGTEQRDYGAYGYYWTGTINTEETRNAYRLEFDDWGADYTSYARYIGHSVRPVMNKPQ